MALTKVTNSMITGAPVNVLDSGAIGDGTTNDTAAINAAIVSNANIIIPKGYTFSVAGINVANKTNFTISGGGKLLLRNASNVSTLGFDTCSHFTVDGIVIDGNGTNQTEATDRNLGCGIRVVGCTDWTVSNNTVTNNYSGAAILAVDNGATVTELSTNGRIINNTITNAGKVGGTFASDGIYANSDNTIVSGNFINTCTDYGIAGDYAHNLLVTDNNIKNVLVGIGVLGAQNEIVSSNYLDGMDLGIAVTLSGNPAIEPFISHNITISGNHIKNVTSTTLLGDGIFVDPSATDVAIIGNHITSVKRGIGCSALDVLIVGNYVDTSAGRTIYADGAGSAVYGNRTKNGAGTTNELGDNYYGTTLADKFVQGNGVKGLVLITTFIGGWSNFGSGLASAGYYMINGRTYLSGVIKGGTTTLGQPIFTLPVGFRPATSQIFVCPEGIVGTNTVIVDSVGSLIYATGTGAQLHLEGISFAIA